MCGGGGSGPDYTTKRTDIGMDLIHVQKLADDRVYKEYIKDSLLRRNWSWNSSPYSRELTEADIDDTKLTLRADNKLAQDALALIADRREYIRNKAENTPTPAKTEKNCLIF